MPKRLSPELRERLENCRGGNPLPSNYFVLVHWPCGIGRENGTTKAYSTFKHPVTINGTGYTGKAVLLDFDGKSSKGFVWSSDDLYYGASCGFRVLDEDDLIRRQVQKANRTGIFPEVYIRVWLHFSDDAGEIHSGVYGDQLFAGFATRIEMQTEDKGTAVAKVWGGHEGIVISRTAPNSNSATSVVRRPIPRSAGR